ncbi:MAG: hypothetical protein WDW38_000790 [Sanguina aurantia]
MGKKRKAEAIDVEAEKTLYTSFVAAANAVSGLYTQAAQQQRKGSAAASRHTLERVICHLLKECNGGDNISKTALLHFLQQEYEGLDGSDSPAHHFPVHFLPNLGAHQPGSMEDACDTTSKQRASTACAPSVLSPVKNHQFNQNSGGAMDLSQSSQGTHQTMYGGGPAVFMSETPHAVSFQQQQHQHSVPANVQYHGQTMFGQPSDGRGQYTQQ